MGNRANFVIVKDGDWQLYYSHWAGCRILDALIGGPDLALLVDKVDPEAVTEQGLVTLLPGESTTFVVRHSEPFDVALLEQWHVIRTANELVAR